jgi:hypothetical protein
MNRLGGILSPSREKRRSSPRIPSGALAPGGRTAAPSTPAGSSSPSVVEDHHGPTPLVSSPSLRNDPHVRGKDLALSRHGCREHVRRRQGRGDGGGEERLKGAQEEKGQMQMACGGHTEPRTPYLYPDGRPMGGTGEKVGTVPVFNVLT